MPLPMAVRQRQPPAAMGQWPATDPLPLNQSGHITQAIQDGRQRDYHYDASERLSQVTEDGIQLGRYQYDPLNRRISKTTGHGSTRKTTLYIYTEEGLLAEIDADTQRLLKSYGWQPNSEWGTQPLWQTEHSGSTKTHHYLHLDHLGTPQTATDKNGTITWQAVSESFGQTRILQDSTSVNLRFPGQYWDAETETHYNYYRDYNPQLGRYLQSDPIGLDGGLNTYAYVYNNPIMFYDPYGLWAWGDPLPQGIVDFSAGFGDTISLGATDWVRNQMGSNGAVNKHSGAYSGGEWAGIAYGFAAGGAAGWRAAGSKAAGKEFSHWIPNRMGGPRSIWNGNYVSTRTHALSDPFRYRFMPRGWKGNNPIWPAWRRQFTRLPNWMKGSGIGGGAASGSAAANGDDYGCQN